jgi:hypothetical protein
MEKPCLALGSVGGGLRLQSDTPGALGVMNLVNRIGLLIRSEAVHNSSLTYRSS